MGSRLWRSAFLRLDSRMLQNLKQQLWKHRSYAYFTGFRYLEFGLLSLCFFFVAHRSGPEEYGNAARSFLTITYSAFFVLGVNQLMVKKFAIYEEEWQKSYISTYNLLYNMAFAAVGFGLTLLLIDQEYKYYVACIVALKLVVESFVSLKRVYQEKFQINLIYLTNASLLTALYFGTQGATVHDFFKYWAIGLSLSVLTSVVLTLKYGLWKNLFKVSFWEFVSANLIDFLKNGATLAIISAFTPLIGTSDKYFLSFSSFDKELLGNMQLADNVAAVVAMGLGPVAFIITPILIGKLSKGQLSVKHFYKQGYKVYTLIILGFCGLLLLTSPVLLNLFSDFDQLLFPLAVYLITRSIVAALFMGSVVSMAFSKEYLYLKQTLIVVVGYLLLQWGAFLLVDEKYQLFYLFPVAGLVAAVLMHVMIYRSYKVNGVFEKKEVV